MSSLKPNLYYDGVNLIGQPNRGMARFTRQLVEVLEKTKLFNQIIGTVPSKFKHNEGSQSFKFLMFSNPLFYEQIGITYFLKSKKNAYFLFPYNTSPIFAVQNVKYIVVVHDLIFMESLKSIPFSKSLWQNLGRYYRRWIVPRSIKNAHSIITVSAYSKQRIIEKFNIPPEKITIIPNSTAHLSPIDNNKEVYRTQNFLCVGGDAPHKNVEFLIDVYLSLHQSFKSEHKLKIVGLRQKNNINKLKKKFKITGDENNIILLPPLKDSELKKLYLESLLLVFPSLYEGFGIPLIEAMYYGCSILCSNTSSLPEIGGNAAFYFDPRNSESLKLAILDCIENKSERDKKLQIAQEQLNLFSSKVFAQNVNSWVSGLLVQTN